MDKSDNVRVGDKLYSVERVDAVQRQGWIAWEYEVVDTARLDTPRGQTLCQKKGWTYRHGVGTLLQVCALHNDAPHDGGAGQRIFWLHPTMLGARFHTSALSAYQRRLADLYTEHQAAVLHLQRAAADLREVAEEYERQVAAIAALAPYAKLEDDDVHSM